MGIFDRLDRLADQLGDLIVPDDVRAHVELGAALLERGDLPESIRELRLALELRPDHPRAAYLLGLACARSGEISEAIAALTQATTARGPFPLAATALGELLASDGQYEAAEEAYRGALQADGGDPEVRADAFRGLGAIYLQTHRLDRAVRELRKAVAERPGDLEAQTLLGRALWARNDPMSARLPLERACSGAKVAPSVLVRLGEVYLALGRPADSSSVLRRALDLSTPRSRDEVSARLQLSRLALDQGDVAEAEREVIAALSVSPDDPDLLVQLARTEARAGSAHAALGAYDRALVVLTGDQRSPATPRLAVPRQLTDRSTLLREALRVALRGDEVERAVVYARALESQDDPLALAALSRSSVASGDLERGVELGTRAVELAASGDPDEALEPQLALAKAHLLAGDRQRAVACLRRAASLAPSDPRSHQELKQINAQAAAALSSSDDPRPILTALHRLVLENAELGGLVVEAGALVELLDQPLVVTVMGEFNAGKSTFVNALIGETVAPMGITPTTATINVIKYGAERGGRVVYLDDTTRSVRWEEIPSLLRGLEPEEARRIRWVEVLYPLETLQRVNLVDTPGLNSLNPEHEQVARAFIAQADVVLWLFSADQAAKATEAGALGLAHAGGRKVLGVLNKIDRLSESEREDALAHVRESLGGHLEDVVPLSARQALQGRTSGDAAMRAASNLAALEQVLEARFFSRSRQLKRAIALERAAALTARSRLLIDALMEAQATGWIEVALSNLRAERALLDGDFLPGERRRFVREVDELLTACAREVLEFVRPRRWAFGANEASPADRDFLIGLVEERLTTLLEGSRARLEAELARSVEIVGRIGSPDDETFPEVPGSTRRLDEQVFARYRAFARGYLRGGRVDDFFARVLPRIDLDEATIRRALEGVGPWDSDFIETELMGPLAISAGRFLDGLARRVADRGRQLESRRIDVEARLLGPLEALAEALASVRHPER